MLFFFNALEEAEIEGDVAYMGQIKMHTQFQ